MTPMTSETKKTEVTATRKLILVLDVENAPKASKEALLKNLANLECLHIVVAYAQTNLAFNIEEIPALSKGLHSGRVIFHKMKSCGKNAADFGLTFFAGQLSGRYKPHEVQFKVLSNDHDLDYMVQMLSSCGYKVERLTSLRTNLAGPATPAKKQPVIVNAVVQPKTSVPA